MALAGSPGRPVSGEIWGPEELARLKRGPPRALPRGSYPTPFLGYLVLWLGSVILKSRRPKKGVGYEPLGIRDLA